MGFGVLAPYGNLSLGYAVWWVCQFWNVSWVGCSDLLHLVLRWILSFAGWLEYGVTGLFFGFVERFAVCD